MKGSAQIVCAVILLAAADGTLGKESKKPIKKFPPSQPTRPFLPPLPLPGVLPHRLEPVIQGSNPLDPYACLPRYLCIVQNQNGEKRTTIVHGLHPAIRKSKPDVIDPSDLPSVPGGIRPNLPPQLSTSGEDDLFRDREFDDSFLKQQEMAEAMAFLEEKRRQFLYQQGAPKSKIFAKGSKPTFVYETKDKDSNEDEEQSKEEKEDTEKSAEQSKEEKEETEKSVEVSKEEKEEAEKSVEVSKEEKEEQEESPEEDSSERSKSSLAKYKLKKKMYSKKRFGTFKTRLEDYDDMDMRNDHIATVPWDDRIRNDTNPLKPKEIYDKLFGKVLPSFQLPKIAKHIPGLSLFTSGSEEEVTTTTTQRPGLLKRMLMHATGSSSSSSSNKKRNEKPMRRYRRDADEEDDTDDDDDDNDEEIKMASDDDKIVKQIRDPARQCRMIYKGCDLPYDHIMKMVSTGKVLIENDGLVATTKKPVTDPSQDDEIEHAIREKLSQKTIPQMLALASLGGKKKIKGVGELPIFGKDKKKPAHSYEESSEEEADHDQKFKPKKAVASLPLMPMRYQWGKPVYNVNGKPSGASDFSGGIYDPNTFTPPPPPPTTTTTTTERPIFASMPLDIKSNKTAPVHHSVIPLNKTHAVHVLSKKPYHNPSKTRTRDAKGRPLSFTSVFTEIAGNTGGIHDFFDRISGAFGGDGTKESGREFPGPEGPSNSDKFPASPYAKPTAFPSAPIPPDHVSHDGDGDTDNEDEEATSVERDNNDEENSDEDTDDDEENDDEEQDEEQDTEQDEEQNEEQDDEDVADDVQQSPKKKNKNKQKEKEQKEKEQKEKEQKEKEASTPIHTHYPLSYLNQEGYPQKQPVKNKRPIKHAPQAAQPQPQQEEEEEEEEEDEEIEDDDEEDVQNLPENVPDFIKQSMIEAIKKKKKEEAEGGADDEGQDGGQGGQQHGAQGHGQQQHGPPQYGQQHGRPGYGSQQGGPGYGSQQGRPGYGSQGGQPSQGGGLFSSFLG